MPSNITKSNVSVYLWNRATLHAANSFHAITTGSLWGAGVVSLSIFMSAILPTALIQSNAVWDIARRALVLFITHTSPLYLTRCIKGLVHSIVIFNPFADEEGERINIPMPYGYNLLYNIGDSLEAAIYSDSERRSLGKLGAELALSFVGSFSPISFQSSTEPVNAMAKTVTPTLLQPMVQLAINENFLGSPIYEDQESYEEKKSDSNLSMRSTKKVYKDVAKLLNDITGGTTHQSGLIDWSPDSIEHIAEFVGGGLYRFADRTVEVGRTIASDTPMETSTTPFLRSVYKEPRIYADQTLFYDRSDELKRIRADVREATGAEKITMNTKYHDKLQLWGLANFTRQRLSALRKQRDRWESESAITEEARQEKLDGVESSMKEAIDSFNKQWDAANR